MDRIEHQATDQIELAKQTLAWIVCAKRQLTSQELQHALAVEPEESHFDEDNIPDLADIISVCAGLVTVDQESEVIRLVHHTTQDYFQRNHSKWFPDAQRSITIASVSYLLLDSFKEGFCATDEDFNVRISRFPLCLYAAKNWGFHAREAMSEESENPMGENLITKLFADAPKLDFAIQILWSVQLDLNFIRVNTHPPRGVTGLHLASWFGMDYLALRLIQRGYPVDARDSKGRTPLLWAAQCESTSMAALLIRNGAIRDSKDTIGQTPLSVATWTGHERMVQVLLEENCDPNCKDRQHQTPLHHAADRGYERIAGYLLKHGANPNAENLFGITPLFVASLFERLPIVVLLLDHGAFPEGKDQRGVTSLIAAASVVNEEIVRILHKRGGQIDTKQNNGQTALFQVARVGTEEMAHLLVSLGANVNIKDKFGRTAISLAAESGKMGVIQRLLKAGGDPEVEDDYGRTSLIQAAANGNTAVVNLLSKLTNANKGDRFGRTALHAAASGGHVESVRALLATDGIDHTPKDIFGSTPLSDATKRSRHDVVSLLQDPTTAVANAIGQEPPSHREPPRARTWCNVCIGFIGDFDCSYRCSACPGGDFDICEICVQCGAHCLDSSHQLDKCQGIADD